MPTYNESGNIEDLILKSVKSVQEHGINDIEIIVVDDDSPDRTWKIAQNVKMDNVEIRVIRRLENHGLTVSLIDGIKNATGDIVIWLDCDFSHPPEKIPQLLFMIQQGYDVAVNSRYVIGAGEDRIGKGGLVQLFLSNFLNWSIRFLLFPAFSDYTSGFIAVKKEVLKNFPLRGDYGEYFVDFIFRVLKSKKYKVCELPFVAPPRKSGESKTGSNMLDYFRRGRKYLNTVFRLKFEQIQGKL